MGVLSFTDVLRKAGLDPERVKLIRHALSDKGFRDCYTAGKILEYTQRQNNSFSKNFDYWCTFISGKSTYAKLHSCYKVLSMVPDTPDLTPEGFPHPEWFDGKGGYYELEHIDCLKEYENRLVIDWGKSTRAWHQKGSIEKSIISIQPNEKKVFVGFENLVLTYDELKTIFDNSAVDDTWQTALSSVYAVYLIVDLVSGKQYVGSAYGQDGLWGRWSTYVATHHGGNKKMIDLLKDDPERYHQLQFSVLQILPKTVVDSEVINVEQLYKEKLKTIKFGLNDN